MCDLLEAWPIGVGGCPFRSVYGLLALGIMCLVLVMRFVHLLTKLGSVRMQQRASLTLVRFT